MSRGKKLVALVTEPSKLQENELKIINTNFETEQNNNFQILENVQFEYVCYELDNSRIENINKGKSSNHDSNFITLLENDTTCSIIENISSSGYLHSLNVLPSQICEDVLSSENRSALENHLDDVNILHSQVSVDGSSAEIRPTLDYHSENDIILSGHVSLDNPCVENRSTVEIHPDDINILPNQVSADELSAMRRSILAINPNSPISDESDADRKLVAYSDTDSTSSVQILKKKKRKKRFQVDKTEWFAEQNKKRRERGKKYLGREKIDGSWIYTKPKEERAIKSRCCCKISKHSTLKCETINESTRKQLFTRFWNLTWGEKKTLVNDWVTTMPSVRPRNRKKCDSTKRANSFVYHLKLNDEYVKVCRKMFLNTLGIGRWTVHHWKTIAKISSRTPNTYRVKTKENPKTKENKSLLGFLESLPVMESHYCRSTSRKLYLLPEWKSKEAIYNFYVDDWCKQRNLKPLSICSFKNLFEEKNFALFRPKKDECEKCACHKVGTVSDEEHQLHIERKEHAREEKDRDKNNNNYVFTVDLQAVLMAPKSNVSTLYYKTKLQVHNLCFFNLKNKDGFCFLWNEVEGGLNAEEFASIWVDFLENTLIPEINADENNDSKTIIIYSDGCTYQNRNCVLSNTLLNVVMRHENITIEQKFLEVGHTQMEADSMHSTIERYLKDRVVNVPAEYISIVRHARRCPAPYIAKYLNHSYFKKIDKVQFYKSIRPGRTKGDPKVTDIRALRYEPSGQISYKIRFKDEWRCLPQRKASHVKSCSMDELTQLYDARRKITQRKYEDLQQIKVTLPSDYHNFYDQLPHE